MPRLSLQILSCLQYPLLQVNRNGTELAERLTGEKHDGASEFTNDRITNESLMLQVVK